MLQNVLISFFFFFSFISTLGVLSLIDLFIFWLGNVESTLVTLDMIGLRGRGLDCADFIQPLCS